MENNNRSISIGGNLEGSAVVSGDNNTVSVHFEKAEIPAPASVNIFSEISMLRQLLTNLHIPDKDEQKVKNALDEADLESKEKEPDRDEIGASIDRALKYAKKAEGFTDVITKLKPHVQNIAGWLGKNWYKILTAVGLTA